MNFDLSTALQFALAFALATLVSALLLGLLGFDSPEDLSRTLKDESPLVT